MSTATLNIKVKEQRMIPMGDAAIYCGLKSKNFTADCPVRAVEVARGVKLYDKRDLDSWIDSLKDGQAGGDEDIIDRLGR